MGATIDLMGTTDEEFKRDTRNSVPSEVKLMMKHLQVLFDQNLQCVFVLEDDVDVNAKNVVAVCVLPAEIAEDGSRQTKEMKCFEKHGKKHLYEFDLQKKILYAHMECFIFEA